MATETTQNYTFAFISLYKTKHSLYYILHRYAFSNHHNNLLSRANGETVISW